MVELWLFRPSAGVQLGVPPVQMIVVFSDCRDQAEIGSVMAAVIKALVELPNLFSASPYAAVIKALVELPKLFSASPCSLLSTNCKTH